MKGVVLAGGLGTRLHPMTLVTNKHLLPVYDQPMIYFPIQAVAEAGMKEVLLVVGGNSCGDFLPLLGDGKKFGLKELHYAFQSEPGGIAQALDLAEDFADGDPILVILGDNIFSDRLAPAVRRYLHDQDGEGARIFVTEVEHPEHFGVPEMDGDKVTSIVEKPKEPKTNMAVVGIYMYDASVFEVIKTLEPSGRGELEITDVNNSYIERGQMMSEILKGWWIDSGSSEENLYDASTLVRKLRKEQSEGE